MATAMWVMSSGWPMRFAGSLSEVRAFSPSRPRCQRVSMSPGAIAFTAVGLIYDLAVTILWHRRRVAAAAAVMGLGMMLVIAILFGLYFPRATFLRVPQLAGEKLRSLNASDAIMIGFTEPSLAFYQGGTIRPRPDNFLTTASPSDWPNWIVLTSDIYQSLPLDRRGRLEQIASYHGFDYNIPMRPVTVIIARKRQ